MVGLKRLVCLATFCFSVTSFGAEGVTVGTGTAKLNGLLQFWSYQDTTAAADANTGFRLRRAELKLSGSIVEKTRWFVMFDPAKGPTVTNTTVTAGTGTTTVGSISTANDQKILQDLGIAYTLCEGLELVMGQFKIPTTTEGLFSSGELLLPERSFVGRTYGDRREPGVMLDHNMKTVRVRVMASNGQVTPQGPGTNIDDTNNSKDVNGRIDYSINDEWKVGAFGSNSHSTSGFSSRYGGNLHVTMGRTLLRIEGMQGKEQDVDRNGLNTELGYQLSDEWQAAARYENFQTTSTPGENSSSAYTLGLNYFLSAQNMKLQLASTVLRNMLGNKGSPSLTTNRDGTVTVLAATASF